MWQRSSVPALLVLLFDTCNVETDEIWILDQQEDGFVGELIRTGEIGNLAVRGGFRCLDVGNSSPYERAVHRASLYREQHHRMIARRAALQQSLHVLEEEYNSTIQDPLQFLPKEVSEFALTCIQASMLTASLDDALGVEQSCSLGTGNVLRLLTDQVRELAMEDSPSAADSSATVSATALFERLENLRLKVRPPFFS